MTRRRRVGALLKNAAIVIAGVAFCELVSIGYVSYAFAGQSAEARWIAVQSAALLALVLAAPLFMFLGVKLRQLRHKNTLLAIRASTDGMTGLLNRRSFAQGFEEEMSLAARSGSVTGALLVIDVDHFKAINDRHGHMAGDNVLIGLAGGMRDLLTDARLIGRLGGEEFGVLLLNLDLRTAIERAEALRKRVAQTALSGHTDGGVTISIGVSGFDRAVTFPQAYAAADKLLYGAKTAGRNRTHSAPLTPGSRLGAGDVGRAESAVAA